MSQCVHFSPLLAQWWDRGVWRSPRLCHLSQIVDGISRLAHGVFRKPGQKHSLRAQLILELTSPCAIAHRYSLYLSLSHRMPEGSPIYPPGSTISVQEPGKITFSPCPAQSKVGFALCNRASAFSLSFSLFLSLSLFLLPRAREGAPSSRRLSCTSVPCQKQSQRAYALAPEKATKTATTATTARPNDHRSGQIARGGTPPYSARTPFEQQLRGSRPDRR